MLEEVQASFQLENWNTELDTLLINRTYHIYNRTIHLQQGILLQGGKYRIDRFLASGGFGCTYEAYHTLLDERVALKEFFVSDF